MPTDPFIYHNSYHSLWGYFNKYLPTSENTTNLVQGRSYYLEAYMCNSGGVGFLDISVEVPNTNSAPQFQAYQVDNITTDSHVQSEIIKFSMIGQNQTGKIEL